MNVHDAEAQKIDENGRDASRLRCEREDRHAMWVIRPWLKGCDVCEGWEASVLWFLTG